MKTLHFPNKSISWLQFPVFLKNGPVDKHLHLTVKFFGDADIDPLAVEARSQIVIDARPQFFSWTPMIFAELSHVLAFRNYPAELRMLHENFNLIRDQFDPWRPHVTVPQKYWLRVQDESLTPQTEEIRLGELELCIGMEGK